MGVYYDGPQRILLIWQQEGIKLLIKLCTEDFINTPKNQYDKSYDESKLALNFLNMFNTRT